MYCWSCGHANPDTHKFCGECGKGLYKPEKVVHEFADAKTVKPAEPPKQPMSSPEPPASPVKPPSERSNVVSTDPVKASSQPPPLAPAAPVVRPQIPSTPDVEPKLRTNPLIEEPRVIHENPIAAAPLSPPVRIHDRVPNRITGPSFLGLSDEPGARSEEGSYLLEDESESGSSWPGYLMTAILVILALLAIRNWGDIRTFASERFGASDSSKHLTQPERVTAGNQPPQSSSDTAAVSTSTPSAEGADSPKKEPEQSAKLDKPDLDKPQSDAQPLEATGDSADETASSAPKPSSRKPAAAAPVYDNSQLDEAQKYLQGRGVPQDCNRGLELLRNAAKQPNPKARTQMAALYMSGHCVTQDAAQAYTWFSRAQELEPRNRLIERNMDSLWARMSDEERRKVLR